MHQWEEASKKQPFDERREGCVWQMETCSWASNYLNTSIPTTKGRSGGTMAGVDSEAAMPDQHTE